MKAKSHSRTSPNTKPNPQAQHSVKGQKTARTLPPHILRYVAFTMIALSVVGSFLLTPPPVAVSITVLAVVRMWVWQREVKREQVATQPQDICTLGSSTKGVRSYDKS